MIADWESNAMTNGVADTAFYILSGGDDFAVDTTPGTSGAYTGNATISDLDMSKVVSLGDLRNQAGCFDRTTGRLTLLNNEMPEGLSGQPYGGDLFAQGGVPPYTWSATILPTWLTLVPSGGSACDCSGIPPTAGTDTLVVAVTDAAGTVVQQRFDITVTAP